MLRSYNVHLVCDLDQRGLRLSTSLIAVIENRLLPRQGSSSAQEKAQLESPLEVTNHQHSRTYRNDICVLGEGAGWCSVASSTASLERLERSLYREWNGPMATAASSLSQVRDMETWQKTEKQGAWQSPVHPPNGFCKCPLWLTGFLFFAMTQTLCVIGFSS